MALALAPDRIARGHRVGQGRPLSRAEGVSSGSASGTSSSRAEGASAAARSAAMTSGWRWSARLRLESRIDMALRRRRLRWGRGERSCDVPAVPRPTAGARCRGFPSKRAYQGRVCAQPRPRPGGRCWCIWRSNAPPMPIVASHQRTSPRATNSRASSRIGLTGERRSASRCCKTAPTRAMSGRVAGLPPPYPFCSSAHQRSWTSGALSGLSGAPPSLLLPG